MKKKPHTTHHHTPHKKQEKHTGMTLVPRETLALDALSQTLDNPKALSVAFVTPEQRGEIEQTLTQCAVNDLMGATQQVRFGEICYKLLHMPDEVLKPVLAQMAQDLEKPAPKWEHEGPGRPPSARAVLAAIIYPEEAQVVREGQKDTLAGKRLTAALLAYERTAGLKPEASPVTTEIVAEASKRSLHTVFRVLWSECHNAKEQKTLHALFARIEGLEPKLLDEWAGELLEEAGPKQLAGETIDITPQQTTA
jgi:hypothetical protein